jgi:hypothetical protein
LSPFFNLDEFLLRGSLTRLLFGLDFGCAFTCWCKRDTDDGEHGLQGSMVLAVLSMFEPSLFSEVPIEEGELHGSMVLALSRSLSSF